VSPCRRRRRRLISDGGSLGSAGPIIRPVRFNRGLSPYAGKALAWLLRGPVAPEPTELPCLQQRQIDRWMYVSVRRSTSTRNPNRPQNARRPDVI
jgi:hypothetical protein